MKEIYLNLLLGLIVIIVVFIYDYLIILKPKCKILLGKKQNKKKKKLVISELQFMQLKHKFEIPDASLPLICILIALINAFIISLTSVIILFIPWNMMWQLLIGFLLLFALIYAIYEIFGRFLEKKYGGK